MSDRQSSLDLVDGQTTMQLAQPPEPDRHRGIRPKLVARAARDHEQVAVAEASGRVARDQVVKLEVLGRNLALTPEAPAFVLGIVRGPELDLVSPGLVYVSRTTISTRIAVSISIRSLESRPHIIGRARTGGVGRALGLAEDCGGGVGHRSIPGKWSRGRRLLARPGLGSPAYP